MQTKSIIFYSLGTVEQMNFPFGGGGGGETRSGTRNHILTTRKAVTLRGGQRIIAIYVPIHEVPTSFFPTVNILAEERSEPAEEII